MHFDAGPFIANSNNYIKSFLFLMLYCRKQPNKYNPENDNSIRRMVISYLEQMYASTMAKNIEKIHYKLIELIEEQNKDRELFNEEISLEHPNIKPYNYTTLWKKGFQKSKSYRDKTPTRNVPSGFLGSLFAFFTSRLR